MSATFDARIDGRAIRCTIRTETDLSQPVLCFSVMAPATAIEGGNRIMSLGGYTEIALPDLKAGIAHEVAIVHEREAFVPANRAWLPLGAYLRHRDGILELPGLPAGVRPHAAPEPRAAGAEALCLCPPPRSWEGRQGVLDARGGFAVEHEAFGEVGCIAVQSRLGKFPFLSPSGVAVAVTLDDSIPPEGYRLQIGTAGIDVAGAGRARVLYAAVTLRHLQITHAGDIPNGVIIDAPRFQWRGQHLDCARHFFSVETILHLLDLMALFKLNRFHWHFADDEAFRLEVACFPELWQGTAFRGEGELIPGVFGGGVRAGGCYSKADVARIVAHGRRLNIEILPEIELPAHALALNRTIAGLRDPEDNGAEISVQGYRDNTINPAIPKMWEFVESLVDEVGPLFPFGHLHLGADELPENTWSGSPAIAHLKRQEGLETTDDVFGWTMARIAARVRALGIRPAAWEEAARGSNGGIGAGALLFSWTGQAPGIAAARAGYDVVMCPAQNAYLDMAHTSDPDDWGAAWAAFIGVEDTVNWSAVPEGARDIAARVVGVEGTFWSEFTTTDSQLWPMLMPRMMGIAAKAWDETEELDGAGMRRLADMYRASMMGAWQWHYGA